MATNLGIDERLLEAAFRAGRRKSKRETVNEALAEYVQRRKRIDVARLFGAVDFDRDFLEEMDRRAHK